MVTLGHKSNFDISAETYTIVNILLILETIWG